MGTGKIASQCARKIPQHLFMSVLCISCLLLITSLDLSNKLADAATGMYAELVQRYIYLLIISDFLFPSFPSHLSLILKHKFEKTNLVLNMMILPVS